MSQDAFCQLLCPHSDKTLKLLHFKPAKAVSASLWPKVPELGVVIANL